MGDGTATCVPYYPGHMYVMYKGKDSEDLCSYRFQTEVELKNFLTLYYGTPHISGACLENIPLILKGEFTELLHFEDFKNSEIHPSDLGELHMGPNSLKKSRNSKKNKKSVKPKKKKKKKKKKNFKTKKKKKKKKK